MSGGSGTEADAAKKKPNLMRTVSGFVMPEDFQMSVEEVYEFGKRLGQPGQFGYAVEARRRDTDEIRACKVIRKSKFNLKVQTLSFFEQLRDEIQIMKQLEHKNVIKFYEVYEDELNLYIVMEHCQGGELFDRITEKGYYSEKEAADVLRQIVEGLEYLHNNKIAHCDLKPDNFLFLDKQEDSMLKIIDFGMSKHVKHREYLKKFCGTPYYVAPEVIDGEYNEASDMWSVGVVMFVMLFGYPPFYCDPNAYQSDAKILRRVKQGFQPITKPNYGPWFPKSMEVSVAAKDLLTKLLTKDRADRLSAKEALSHPWLTGEEAREEKLNEKVFQMLEDFQQASKFKETVLTFISDHLRDDQLGELQLAFEKLDKNGDGVITKQELTEALREISSDSTEEKVEDLMSTLDIDHDGTVSYEEMKMVALNHRLIAKEERLWETFRRLDIDGNGKITAEELAQVTKDHSVENAEEMIAEVDVDGDGTVDYEEFLNLFAKEV